MSKVVVTYTNADLDCVASAYGYAEFLRNIGEDADYFISGKVQDEVNIVCSMFDIDVKNDREQVSPNEQVVVVDTNKISAVSFVNPDQVVEVIDHHPESGDEFKNASMDIQKIGAVCTMIAEKFEKEKIELSRETAILLYYGIVSNTVNFHSKVTDARDRKMASWLKQQCPEIDEELIEKIFKEKGQVDISNLRNAMEVEETFKLGNDEIIIGQLEITEARNFINEHRENIDSIIDDVEAEYGVQIVFINVIDTLEGYHILYAPQEATRRFLGNFGLAFKGDSLEEEQIVLRKEIKNELRKRLEAMLKQRQGNDR